MRPVLGFLACMASGACGYPPLPGLRPDSPIQPVLASCREIVAANKAEGDGAYEIDFDGDGPNAPQTVWCDMTIDGGGWMALINPDVMPTTMAVGAGFAGAAVGGTVNSCNNPPFEIIQHGWRGLQYAICGDRFAQLTVTWPNPVAATDVMFIATTEGQTQTLLINGNEIPASGSTADAAGGRCGFWNGSGMTATPATNACKDTFLDAAPFRKPGAISGALKLEITAGPACAPNCNYSAGMNLQKLFVR
jgi:hypothetical protein